MTRLVLDVTRDDDGRLHGTVAPEGPDQGRVDFTGVMELVATIEASLDEHPRPDEGAAGPPA